MSDTVDLNHIFEDSEIVMATAIATNVWQSGMFYSGSSGAYVPAVPVSYFRIAAILLDAIASNKSRLSSITQLLDVKLSPEIASKALREQSDRYRLIDDESGAFAIAEQVTNNWTFKERFWKQAQRLTA